MKVGCIFLRHNAKQFFHNHRHTTHLTKTRDSPHMVAVWQSPVNAHLPPGANSPCSTSSVRHDTISTAITAAETGHLVLGTLHTVDAVQTVDRIIDAFPPEHQHQIRLQLSQVLEGVLSQTLVPKATGSGRVGVFEILIANGAVRNLIRTNKTFELPSVLQLGQKEGMQSLNQALAHLVNTRVISLEEAVRKSSEPEQLQRLIHGY